MDEDEDDEEDDDAEEGFDPLMVHDKAGYGAARDEGPSARDIDGLLRGKDLWRSVTEKHYEIGSIDERIRF